MTFAEIKTKEDILYLLKLSDKKSYSVWHEHFKEREMDIFVSRGYDSDEHKTILFCVRGSPNKCFGTIDCGGGTSNNFPMKIITNLGWYWVLAGDKVSKRNW